RTPAKNTAERREQRPVSRRQRRSRDLPLEHTQLIPQDQLSRRGESHPPALSDPGVSLSTHRAPVIQPVASAPRLPVGKEHCVPSCDGFPAAPCSPGAAAP